MTRNKQLRQPSAELRGVVADNIRQFRGKNGLSQEEFAATCGLHRTYIGSIERSERNLTLSTLELLSRHVGLTVPELLTRQRRDGPTDNESDQ